MGTGAREVGRGLPPAAAETGQEGASGRLPCADLLEQALRVLRETAESILEALLPADEERSRGGSAKNRCKDSRAP